MMSRQLGLKQLMKVEEHEDQVGHLLLLPMTASKFQIKGTLKEHKSKKENIEEKPDVNTRKPIVKCNKLIVYDGTNTRLHDDSYNGGCTMPGSKGYSRLQTARRGKPYKGTPMGRSVSPRNLGNLNNAPGYLQIEEVEEQQYVSNIIHDAEISVDNEVKYEDWCAVQGLMDISSGSPDKNEECVSDEKLQKQITSLNITLDLIHDFVQKNFISEEYKRNIILRKLYAICGHIEESDKKKSAEKTELIKSTEKKETEKLEGGIVNEGKTNSAENMELVKSTEKKETEKLEGGIVNEGKINSSENMELVKSTEKKETEKLEGGIVNEGKTNSAENMELVKSTEKKETEKLEGGIVNEGKTNSSENMELVKSTEKKETEKLEGGIVNEGKTNSAENMELIKSTEKKQTEKLEGGIVNEGKTNSAENMELIKSTEKKETEKLEAGIVNEGNTKSTEKTELVKSTEKIESDKLEGGILKEIVNPSPKKKDTKVSPIKEISQKQKENVKVPKNVAFTDKEEVYELHVETEDNVCSNATYSVLNEDDIPLSQIQQAAAEIVMHDDMDDIPLSQIKTGDRMVRYRENLEIDTESDEFSTSNTDENQEQTEVVEEILQELNRTLEEAEMECQIEKAEVVTFNSGNGGTGVSESFEGVSQSDVSSVKRGETVTVQSTVTDEKG